MESEDSLLRFFFDYPIALDALKVLTGAFIPTLIAAFKLGQYRERIKIDSVKLAELKAEVDKAQKAENKQRIRADALQAEIARMNEVAHIDCIPFLKNSKEKFRVICPGCLANGSYTRLLVSAPRDGNYHLKCPIPTCKVEYTVPESTWVKLLREKESS